MTGNGRELGGSFASARGTRAGPGAARYSSPTTGSWAASQYEIYFSDDRSECIVLERYKDSEALLEHANLSELGAAILATGLVSSELLGEPGAELRAKLADGPVRLFTPFLSM